MPETTLIAAEFISSDTLPMQKMKSPLAPSANFKNPFGLLLRMLTSGKRAAYSALIHEGLRIVTKPLDSLLQRKEKRLLGNSLPADLPVLLVVGAPRSGTTLVYQTLARYLDTSYFSNLTSFFPKSAISGTRMFNWLAGRHAADFENFYGQTAGLGGPNDGFAIWNQWLGNDRYVPRTDLNAEEMSHMRRFFDAWSNTFGKPFLNKNNRNTSCLDQLARALPNARFIVVRRNPILVAQSLITARQQVQGDKSIGWGLMAQDKSSDADPLSYVDDVCDQILQIEAELDQQISHIPADRIVEVTYEGFCEAPESALREIAAKIPGVGLSEQLMLTELKPFKASTSVTLTEEEQGRLMSRLSSRRLCKTDAVAVIH